VALRGASERRVGASYEAPSGEKDGWAGRDGSSKPVERPDLVAYRAAVSELVEEVSARLSGPGVAGPLDGLVTARLGEPELLPVLDGVPGGADAATTGLARELQAFRPSSRSSASDPSTLVRIYLLSQIDAMWWRHVPPYETDADVAASPELLDLGPLRSAGQLRFQYRSRPDGVAGRTLDWAVGRVFPGRWPPPGHLRFTRARAEAIAFLDRLALEVSRATAGRTPPLWVTSLVRSVQHQHRLRALGFAALLPSSHCVGYGIDIELSWFRQYDTDGALPRLLFEHQERGEVNVINEGPAWHVCLNPAATEELARAYWARAGTAPGEGLPVDPAPGLG
jgi:hypothetical protein